MSYAHEHNIANILFQNAQTGGGIGMGVGALIIYYLLSDDLFFFFLIKKTVDKYKTYCYN